MKFLTDYSVKLIHKVLLFLIPLLLLLFFYLRGEHKILVSSKLKLFFSYSPHLNFNLFSIVKLSYTNINMNVT